MQDHLVQGMFYNGQLRAFACDTRNTLLLLQKLQNTSPVATAALGRSLSCVAMMGGMLKDHRESISLSVHGDGPLGRIIVQSNAAGNLRGMVQNPLVDVPFREDGKLNVAEAVGTEGFIVVKRDMGLKEPYVGTSPIVSGELGEDFTHYFALSEQIPTAVGVGVLLDSQVLIQSSGGFILQVLPDMEEENILDLETKLANVHSVTSFLSRGLTPFAMLQEILQEKGKQTSLSPLQFKCSCSRDYLADVLKGLGNQELLEILEDKGEAHITCEFCQQDYVYEKEELQSWLQKD